MWFFVIAGGKKNCEVSALRPEAKEHILLSSEIMNYLTFLVFMDQTEISN